MTYGGGRVDAPNLAIYQPMGKAMEALEVYECETPQPSGLERGIVKVECTFRGHSQMRFIRGTLCRTSSHLVGPLLPEPRLTGGPPDESSPRRLVPAFQRNPRGKRLEAKVVSRDVP